MRSRKRSRQVAALGCVLCHGPATIHHVPPTRRRPGDDLSAWRDDRYILPLCWEHHQGRTGVHGMGLRTWTAHFGTEARLLDNVDAAVL